MTSKEPALLFRKLEFIVGILNHISDQEEEEIPHAERIYDLVEYLESKKSAIEDELKYLTASKQNRLEDINKRIAEIGDKVVVPLGSSYRNYLIQGQIVHTTPYLRYGFYDDRGDVCVDTIEPWQSFLIVEGS